jgi:hypothetical protein
LPVVSGATPEGSRIILIAIAGVCRRLTPVVITVAITGAAAAATTRGVPAPLVVSRIEVSRIEVHG